MSIIESPIRVRVDGARLLRTLDELARIGADPAGGITRPGFSPPEREARAYMARAARRLGLVTEVDSAGNLIVRRHRADPAKPTLLMGSHLDTVSRGGPLDGAYGVVAAIEVVGELARQGDLALEPVAMAFSNEEGALFPYPFFGSKAVAGESALPADMPNGERQALARELSLGGGSLEAIDSARWRGPIAAYLELHIEQGPVLEAHGIPIGVVDVIYGRTLIQMVIRGRQAHAGTTPMPIRADALAAAASAILAIESIAKEAHHCSVSTVGTATVRPGEANVIPGEVWLTAEIRDSSRARLDEAEREIARALVRIGAERSVNVASEVVMRTDPVPTAGPLRAAIRAAATGSGLLHMDVSSGAGHDAQIINALAPIGMIFVPSRGGLSHVPDEHTDDEDLVRGADVLLQTALALIEERSQT